MSSEAETLIVVSVLIGAVRMGTILLIAAMGELVVERSGVLNLSVEGMMLIGALIGFVVAFSTESMLLGVLAAAGAGMLAAAVFGLMTVVLQIDQTVSGLTINIFASGFTFYLYRALFPDVGTQTIPNLVPIANLEIPVLSTIPIVGELFFAQSAYTYLAVVLWILIAFYLHRTRGGLIVRTVGENPRAVDMKGISVIRYRFLAVLFGGMLAGLAGSIMTLGSAGLFVSDMVAGRGWLAIAIVIFSDWKLGRLVLASLFFGLIDALQMQVQASGMRLPTELFLAMPYILTVVALFIGRRRTGAPLALGVAYVRE
jgi:simple sugar transport system permease protein